MFWCSFLIVLHNRGKMMGEWAKSGGEVGGGAYLVVFSEMEKPSK
jgi:hypothetical protein